MGFTANPEILADSRNHMIPFKTHASNFQEIRTPKIQGLLDTRIQRFSWIQGSQKSKFCNPRLSETLHMKIPMSKDPEIQTGKSKNPKRFKDPINP